MEEERQQTDVVTESIEGRAAREKNEKFKLNLMAALAAVMCTVALVGMFTIAWSHKWMLVTTYEAAPSGTDDGAQSVKPNKENYWECEIGLLRARVVECVGGECKRKAMSLGALSKEIGGSWTTQARLGKQVFACVFASVVLTPLSYVAIYYRVVAPAQLKKWKQAAVAYSVIMIVLYSLAVAVYGGTFHHIDDVPEDPFIAGNLGGFRVTFQAIEHIPEDDLFQGASGSYTACLWLSLFAIFGQLGVMSMVFSRAGEGDVRSALYRDLEGEGPNATPLTGDGTRGTNGSKKNKKKKKRAGFVEKKKKKPSKKGAKASKKKKKSDDEFDSVAVERRDSDVTEETSSGGGVAVAMKQVSKKKEGAEPKKSETKAEVANTSSEKGVSKQQTPAKDAVDDDKKADKKRSEPAAAVSGGDEKGVTKQQSAEAAKKKGVKKDDGFGSESTLSSSGSGGLVVQKDVQVTVKVGADSGSDSSKWSGGSSSDGVKKPINISAGAWE